MQISKIKPRSLSTSNTIYKHLISIYPASFKQSFRIELRQVFDNKTQSVYQKSGWAGVSAFWLRTLFDTFQTAFREHIEELFQMKLNPKKTTTSIFALLAGLLTVFIVMSNWADFPYPFPTKLSLYGKYETFNIIDEDNKVFYDYLEGVIADIHYKTQFSVRSVVSLPDSVYEEILGVPPNIPRGQKPSIDNYSGSYLFYGKPTTETFSAQFRESSWGPEMVVGKISLWANYNTPLAITLPLLWLGALILLMLWTESGKLGYFSLSLGIIGSFAMLISIEELFRDFNFFNVHSIDSLWLIFSIGMFMMGIGMVLFGADRIIKKTFSLWNALPIFMGVSLVSLEIISRFYLTNDFILWPKVQGVVLLLFSLSWIPFAFHFFGKNKLELSPA